MAKSQIKGRDVEYVGNIWVYVDDGEPIAEAVPCKRCGAKSTTGSPFYTGGHCVQPSDPIDPPSGQ